MFPLNHKDWFFSFIFFRDVAAWSTSNPRLASELPTYMLQQPREKSKTSGLAANLRCIFNRLEKTSNLNADHGPAIKLIPSPAHAVLPSLVVRMHDSDILGKLGIFVQDVAISHWKKKSKGSSSSFLCIGWTELFHRSASCTGNDREILFDHTTPGFSSMIPFWWLNKCNLHQTALLSAIFQPHPGNSAQRACSSRIVWNDWVLYSMTGSLNLYPYRELVSSVVTNYSWNGDEMMCIVVNVGTFQSQTGTLWFAEL